MNMWMTALNLSAVLWKDGEMPWQRKGAFRINLNCCRLRRMDLSSQQQEDLYHLFAPFSLVEFQSMPLTRSPILHSWQRHEAIG